MEVDVIINIIYVALPIVTTAFMIHKNSDTFRELDLTTSILKLYFRCLKVCDKFVFSKCVYIKTLTK
jgi:hypothetical protein